MTPPPARLDTALVRRGLVTSRTRAAQLIRDGAVQLDGAVVTRPSAPVGPAQVVEVDASRESPWVSRAGHKLSAALDAAEELLPPGVPVRGTHALDAGASTGGFTQVLLSRGADAVDAVDVGHGQLAEQVRAEPRVRSVEGLNVRDLELRHLSARPGVVVADLSFISLTLVLPRLLSVAGEGAHLLLMVKPQFEVGRERLGADGVVSSAALRAEAVLAVAEVAVTCGCRLLAVIPSGLAGEAGNREYFLWLVAPGAGQGTAETGVPGAETSCWAQVRGAVIHAVRAAVRDDEPARVERGPEGGEPR